MVNPSKNASCDIEKSVTSALLIQQISCNKIIGIKKIMQYHTVSSETLRSKPIGCGDIIRWQLSIEITKQFDWALTIIIINNRLECINSVNETFQIIGIKIWHVHITHQVTQDITSIHITNSNTLDAVADHLSLLCVVELRTSDDSVHAPVRAASEMSCIILHG